MSQILRQVSYFLVEESLNSKFRVAQCLEILQLGIRFKITDEARKKYSFQIINMMAEIIKVNKRQWLKYNFQHIHTQIRTHSCTDTHTHTHTHTHPHKHFNRILLFLFMKNPRSRQRYTFASKITNLFAFWSNIRCDFKNKIVQGI